VLSPSTESYDRGRKFEHYRAITSLREYVLVAQDRPRVQKFVRQEDGTWLFVEASGVEGAMALASISGELALAAVCEGIRFGP
jgi:Uma2 family endonuclease